MEIERLPAIFAEILRTTIAPVLEQRQHLQADRMHGGYLTVLTGVDATRLSQDPPDLCMRVGTIVAVERRRKAHKASMTDACHLDELYQLLAQRSIIQEDSRRVYDEEGLGAAIVVADVVVAFAGPPYDACEALILFSMIQAGHLSLKDAIRLARLSRNHLFFENVRLTLRKSGNAQRGQYDGRSSAANVA